MKACIVGAGPVGLGIAASLSKFAEVTLVTRQEIRRSIRVVDDTKWDEWYSNPIDVVKSVDDAPECDFTLLTVPANVVPEILWRILDTQLKHHPIGCVTGSGGFHWMAGHILKGAKTFSFQRVPFICQYRGEKGTTNLISRKQRIIQHGCHHLAPMFSAAFDGVMVDHTPDVFDVAITNSNPLLHPCRLASLIWSRYAGKVPFYVEWDHESSVRLVACDAEVGSVRRALGGEMMNVLDHYGVSDEKGLTDKFRNLAAFSTFDVALDDGAVAVNNRHFDEDVFCGLSSLRGIARMVGVETPNLDSVFSSLVEYARSQGSWAMELGDPTLWGFKTIDELRLL